MCEHVCVSVSAAHLQASDHPPGILCVCVYVCVCVCVCACVCVCVYVCEYM